MAVIESHRVVPARIAVEDAHDVCARLERALREEVDEAVITLHDKPKGTARHRGVLFLEGDRVRPSLSTGVQR